MRLNKSFIVRRSITGRREKLAAYQVLSAYINHSIRNDGESVWIAQAEGRARMVTTVPIRPSSRCCT